MADTEPMPIYYGIEGIDNMRHVAGCFARAAEGLVLRAGHASVETPLMVGLSGRAGIGKSTFATHFADEAMNDRKHESLRHSIRYRHRGWLIDWRCLRAGNDNFEVQHYDASLEQPNQFNHEIHWQHERRPVRIMPGIDVVEHPVFLGDPPPVDLHVLFGHVWAQRAVRIIPSDKIADMPEYNELLEQISHLEVVP